MFLRIAFHLVTFLFSYIILLWFHGAWYGWTRAFRKYHLEQMGTHYRSKVLTYQYSLAKVLTPHLKHLLSAPFSVLYRRKGEIREYLLSRSVCYHRSPLYKHIECGFQELTYPLYTTSTYVVFCIAVRWCHQSYQYDIGWCVDYMPCFLKDRCVSRCVRIWLYHNLWKLS